MSKFSKFVKTPSLFFRDYFAKRVASSNGGSLDAKSNSQTGPLKSTPSLTNLDTSNFNRFKKYKYYLHNGENMTAGPNHLNMWLPLLMSFRIPFLLIIRDLKLYTWVLKNYPTVDVAFAKSAGDIGEVVAMTRQVSLALYSSSTGNNIHLVRFEEIKHCFIGHGDSEKASSAHKALRMFDEIWVASQAHIDRFRNKSFNTMGLNFLKIGRPTLIDALKQAVKPWHDRGVIKMLYLPTWEGSNYKNDYSSVRFATPLLEMASKRAMVHAKLHPFTGNRDKTINNAELLLDSSFKESINVSIISSNVPLLDVYSGYNIFICDISSVVTECLALDVPIFLYYPKNIEIEIAASNMVFDDYCYVFSTLEEFEILLDRVIGGDDYKKESRKQAVDYFIGVNESKNMRLKEILSI